MHLKQDFITGERLKLRSPLYVDVTFILRMNQWLEYNRPFSPLLIRIESVVLLSIPVISKFTMLSSLPTEFHATIGASICSLLVLNLRKTYTSAKWIPSFSSVFCSLANTVFFKKILRKNWKYCSPTVILSCLDSIRLHTLNCCHFDYRSCFQITILLT